jgi:hypothetical protein
MSITASYRRLSVEEFNQLRQNQSLADTYFGDDLDDEDEDAWDACPDVETSGLYQNYTLLGCRRKDILTTTEG